jgi:sugar phosphate isomerase/epimerase
MMRLCFSTLACEEWAWEKICRKAAEYGYAGVELRFTAGIKDLLQNPEFQPAIVPEALQRARQAGIETACVDSSVKLVANDQLAHGKGCIDIAAGLNCPRVRVFCGKPREGVDHEDALDFAASQAHELAVYGQSKGVRVLLETHDYSVKTETALEIIQRVDHENFGILWDVHHTHRMAGEEIRRTWSLLSPYCDFIHVKESHGNQTKFLYCLPGEGDFPWDTLASLLKEDGFSGWLSVEWERAWIPALEPPETALPAYAAHLRRLGLGS